MVVRVIVGYDSPGVNVKNIARHTTGVGVSIKGTAPTNKKGMRTYALQVKGEEIKHRFDDSCKKQKKKKLLLLVVTSPRRSQNRPRNTHE